MFKLWSDTKPDVKRELKPDLGLRKWDSLEQDEKNIIWQHLDWYFFDKDPKSIPEYNDTRYKFYGNYSYKKLIKASVFYSIASLNQLYKAKNYASNFLENMNLDSACLDFYNIFLHESGNVVIELLSLYCRAILAERECEEPYHEEKESNEDFKKRTDEWRYESLDSFSERINEIFEDFNINVFLARQGFMLKQDEKITKEIFTPVLSFLSDSKWEKVNDHFRESFKAYQNKDFSNSITNTISAIQAFLQLLVNGKVGKGNISGLIIQAQKSSLIPSDSISKQIFKNMESIFAIERQEKSNAHPRTKNSDESNARVIINLAMVFIQHCIQS